LLPDGAEVVVGYIDAKKHTMFRRVMWLVTMQIVVGQHSGRRILWFLRALNPERRVTRSSALATSYTAATGLRPPSDLGRRHPRWWLSDAQYMVRTRQVRHDVHGLDRSEAASYSVVKAVLARVAGTPPAARRA